MGTSDGHESGACIFDGDQLDNVRALKSFMNYKQNKLGPIDTLQVDNLKVTAEDYENFVCNFDGTVISYDDDKATSNLQSRNEHEARCKRQEATALFHGQPNKKDSDSVVGPRCSIIH